MEEPIPVSAMQSIPEWIIQLLEDFCYEASLPQVKLLANEGRSAVWQTCLWFGCEKRGVPGLACQLLERYLFIVLHEDNSGTNEEELQRSLQVQLPILIASCITLASKMNTSNTPVEAKLVHVIYLCKRIKCTVEEIIASEAKVYSKLKFRIPLRTNVEIGEMLAAEIGIPFHMLDTVAMLVDVAECRRYTINKKVRFYFSAMLPALSIADVLTLHLIAGAVSAVGPFCGYVGPNMVQRLCQLTKASTAYIKYIGDVICTVVLSDIPQRNKHSLKRK